jgi:hypothetical protein
MEKLRLIGINAAERYLHTKYTGEVNFYYAVRTLTKECIKRLQRLNDSL